MPLSDEFAATFDDYMLVPQYSKVTSRKDPDTSTKLGRADMLLPIVASPMNTVTEGKMAEAMAIIGADSVLHRYMTIEDQCHEFLSVLDYEPWVAVGASGDMLERVTELHKCGARKFCIDVANGHSELTALAVHNLKYQLGDDVTIMAGNVCTADGAATLENSGADVIRVGIGPGSMCTTRLVTGFGVPQLTAIKWCAEGVRSASIVADGGIRSSGDIVKALAMGADAIMIGGLLAGTSQSPGGTKTDEAGNLYKMYHGMASEEGRKNWFDKEATAYVPEGSSTKVAFKGCAKKIVERLCGGLRVGMSFANALTLEELRNNAEWVRVTENGRIEGTPNKRLHK